MSFCSSYYYVMNYVKPESFFFLPRAAKPCRRGSSRGSPRLGFRERSSGRHQVAGARSQEPPEGAAAAAPEPLRCEFEAC